MKLLLDRKPFKASELDLVEPEAPEPKEDLTGFIPVEVRAVRGVPSGLYKVPYKVGANLKYYLSQLNLVSVGTRSYVYDKSHLGNGKCRPRYVPKEDSHLLMMPPGSSPFHHRTADDAMKLARNMGKKGSGPAPRYVDVNMTYGRKEKK